jgi:hypothetical protein
MNETLETRRLHTYAEPLSGRRVSWGAILSGALASVATSLLLWALALAIVVTASSATPASREHGMIALWISGIVATLIGAIVGGFFAGYLPGNNRRGIGTIHGFLAWAVAFVAVSLLEAAVVGRVMNPPTGQTFVRPPLERETMNSVAPDAPVQSMEALLETLGYSHADAARIVGAPAAAQAPPMTGPRDDYRAMMNGPSAGRFIREYGDLLAWSWFGTWAISGVLAVIAAATATRRLGGDASGVGGGIPIEVTEPEWVGGEAGPAGAE